LTSFYFILFLTAKADGSMDNLLKLLYIAQCTHNITPGAVVLQHPENLSKVNPLSNPTLDCSPESVIANQMETFARERKQTANAKNKKRRRSIRLNKPTTMVQVKKPTKPTKPPAVDANTMTGLNASSRTGLDKIHVYCRNHTMRALLYNAIHQMSSKTTWTSNRTEKTFKELTVAQLKVSILRFDCYFYYM
tara:strand:- start:1654 stop:2229 length:576 start_codon:yes stop_codon:yes gene_type:complete